MQALAPALSELPPVMASCDGIVYDSLSGEALKAVEGKHRCPFLPSSGQTFFFKGDRMIALEDVPLKYLSQCQLQMLVQDLPHCDLISYALPGSHIFTIPRDDQWLSLALRLLAHLQQKYIQADRVPEADMHSREVPQLFSVFTSRTKHCMAELQRKPRLDVPSSVDRSACQIFLDDLPDSQPAEEGSRWAYLSLLHARMRMTPLPVIHVSLVHLMQRSCPARGHLSLRTTCPLLLPLQSLKRGLHSWKNSQMIVRFLEAMKTVSHKVLSRHRQDFSGLQASLSSSPWQQSLPEGPSEP